MVLLMMVRVMVRMVIPVDKKVRMCLHPFVTLPPAQEATVVKHVFGHRVQRPVVTLTRVSRFPRDFYEAIIQRQIVPNRVLPGREFVPVIWKPGHDKLANTAQREFLVRRLEYGHGDQGYVAIWWFDGRPISSAWRFVDCVIVVHATARRCLVAAAIASAAIVIVVAPGGGAAGSHIVVFVVVVGRIHINVRRLGRANAARWRVGHRRGRSDATSQIQRTADLVHGHRI